MQKIPTLFNRDDFQAHMLMAHGWAPFSVRIDLGTAPRDYAGLHEWLHARPYEGIVWHHPDGRMAKIRSRYFPRADRPGKRTTNRSAAPQADGDTAAARLPRTEFDPEDRSSCYEVEIDHEGPIVYSECCSDRISLDTARTFHAALGRWIATQDAGEGPESSDTPNLITYQA
ncbi:hypothetical protein [Streptomyces anulatus]|uniref:hypothetical protein n=1 Tax=Streptomyces anulatus TaxID=1892 RepID=UPI0036803C61